MEGIAQFLLLVVVIIVVVVGFLGVLMYTVCYFINNREAAERAAADAEANAMDDYDDVNMSPISLSLNPYANADLIMGEIMGGHSY